MAICLCFPGYVESSAFLIFKVVSAALGQLLQCIKMLNLVCTPWHPSSPLLANLCKPQAAVISTLAQQNHCYGFLRRRTLALTFLLFWPRPSLPFPHSDSVLITSNTARKEIYHLQSRQFNQSTQRRKSQQQRNPSFASLISISQYPILLKSASV